MTSAAWSGCNGYMYFYIQAMGKMNGQPINSGDIVAILCRLPLRAMGAATGYIVARLLAANVI